MPASLNRRRFLQLTSAAAGTALLDLSIVSLPSPAGAVEGEISANSFVRSPEGAAFVDLVYTPNQSGYWIVSSDGKVFAIDAAHHGHLPAMIAGETVVAMASTPDGGGYWLFSSAGRVFVFGNATHFGDMTGIALAAPVIDGVALDDGSGYYLLGVDGGIFAFGEASFHGSIPGVLPGVTLDQPIAGLVPHDRTGYWLVAGDGGLFAFGTAPFAGSVPQVLPNTQLAEPVIGALSSGNAYLMVASDGGIFNFGNSVFHGSLPGVADVDSIPDVTAVDVVDDRSGYTMLDKTGVGWGFGSAEPDPAGFSSGVQARSTHAFISSWDDGEPFRWSSDEAIHFVINNDLGPTGAVGVILDAVAEVSELTGLEFVYDGETDEYIGHVVVAGMPRIANRSEYQPERYGDRWAPVWIGARPYQSGLLPLAVAVSVAHWHVRVNGDPTYVTGHVGYHWGSGSQLSFDDLGAVIRHEMGHIVGLDHCNEVRQLMYPSLGFNNGFGIGDHIGLHAIGKAAKHPPAPHPSQGIPLQFLATPMEGTPGSRPNGPCFGDAVT